VAEALAGQALRVQRTMEPLDEMAVLLVQKLSDHPD
jgi:hypothetical protein